MIKPQTIIDVVHTEGFGNAPPCLILKGWRKWDYSESRPPFIYLGYKYENWTYNYQNTNKIHYVHWMGDLYVMDNQFAKHIVPVGDYDGQD